MKKNKKNDEGGLVYSTNPDYTPETIWDSLEDKKTPGKQNLRLWVQRIKGDKKITLIKGFEGSEDEIESLAKSLRQQCSCGGSVKEGEIILQGDVRDKAAKVLEKLGHRYKLAGG